MALEEHYDNVNRLKADICFEMLDYIRDRGWVKGTWMDSQNHVCIEGALNLVCIGVAQPRDIGTGQQIKNYIARRVPPMVAYAWKQLQDDLNKYLAATYGYKNVPQWNDLPETSLEDVEKLLMQRGEFYEQRYLSGLRS